MCDKKNNVLFIDTEFIVLSSDFKLPDENHVLLRVPRENNMYNVDLKNIVPSGDLTCLFGKATLYESNLWHRRLGHINFKTINKLVKCNLVRGLPLKFLKIIIHVLLIRRASNIEPLNEIAERKNMTLIEAARTMLADSLLPILFWAEAVNTACYVQNRVLVTKPHNKTPYELLLGRTPSIGFIRPFSCHVTILNTLDPLGKFDRKADEGFLVGYSVSSKAFRVFNNRTIIIQETLHINFLENQPNVVGSGPTWLFDIDTLTQSMNYQPIFAGNQPNSSAGIQEHFDAGTVGKENVQQYVLLPLWSSSSKDPPNIDIDATFEVKEPESEFHVSSSNSNNSKKHDQKTKREAKGKSHVDLSTGVRNLSKEFEDFSFNSTNGVNAASALVTAVKPNSTNSTNSFNVAGPSNSVVSLNFEIGGKSSFEDPSKYPDDPTMPELEDITYSDDEESVGAEADFSNLETRFKDPDYPDKVYKVVKALYGLHQALRAWYETLANYLLENGFQKGKIDQTLFIKRQKGDILLVQVYVDDIIFGSTNKDLCNAFKKLMKDKFQMSSIGELTLFLGLQVKQKHDGIFISQDKHVAKILRKFGLTDRKSASTPIDTKKPLLKDPDGEDVDVHTYRSIGSLMYLTSSRPDRDYAGASIDRKSTTGGCQFLGQTATGKENSNPFMADSLPKTILLTFIHGICINMNPFEFSLVYLVVTSVLIITTVSSTLLLFGLTIDVVHLMLLGHNANEVMRLQALIDRRNVIITEDTIRQALRLNDADSVDCLLNEEIFAELARMGYEKPSIKFTFYKAFFLAQ
nr:putative ribonuclease H-like domain-containing protein [Tanacetum cinerariifolium]